MKEIVAVIFGLGLGCNALLFVPLADPRHGGQPADLRIGYGIDYLIQNQTVAGQGR